ncbi:baseplate hub protein [Sphingobium sp. WCS2017Hpa-17]|uniref:baseplate hub protein n=1 Tax=Sphingobium sp. WCS2017Hpa-17 TaxID=3073638 RepID=UPI002889A2CD|nr:hypothetical protein [Sphingobium sp. WCS2017Hpa-17]
MAFAKRIINLKFQLGQGDFGTGGNNTVDLSGLRCSVNIVKSGYNVMEADIRVWGMPLDLMNKLTVVNRLGMQEYRANTVTIMAGDEESGVSVCFKGTVFEAWVDAGEPPDVMFHVFALSSLFDTSEISPPTSYKGSVDAAFALSGVAAQMGYGFENGGVQGKLFNPYYPGDARAQISKMCEDVNCAFDFDEDRKMLAVWPKDGSRNGQVEKISPSTGMIGYPSFTQSGIRFATVYNPNIVFGRAIIMESQLQPANGQWVVASLAHQLDSEVPNGQWLTDIECGYLGHIA